jgi:hypothetical protein
LNKSCVFLFGAGAVLDWGAPSTPDLTELVRKSGFCLRDSELTITEFIYQKLLNSPGFLKSCINFETIINVIDDLIIYYSYFDYQPFTENPPKKESLQSIFFTNKYGDEILDFSIEYETPLEGFKLKIPHKGGFTYSKKAYPDTTPKQLFFQELLSRVLDEMSDRISQYSYHTENHSKVICQNNDERNRLFARWMSKIANDYYLRMYTLNYDRNFKVILENSETPIQTFEGFTMDVEDSYFPPDILKIIADTQCNVHYNLHGSIFWHIDSRDESQFQNPRIYLRKTPRLPVYSLEHPSWQGESDKMLLLTNIITGYQKTQRSIFSPYYQIQSSFNRDCCTADMIFIIGYSFGDAHINSTLRTAISENKKVKIFIVHPHITDQKFLLNAIKKVFSAAGEFNETKRYTIRDKKHSFYNDKIILHEQKFEDFLTMTNLEDICC